MSGLTDTRSRAATGGVTVPLTLWKNAVDDGGLDPTGATDQTTQIASFYASVPTNGVAYFPAGTYQGLHAPGKSLTVLGDGRNRTTFTAPTTVAATSKMVNFGSSLKCALVDVKLNAGGNANIARGVDMQQNGSDKSLRITGCWFENFTSTTGLTPHAGGAAGIYVWTADDVVIDDNDFVDCLYPILMDSPGPDCRVTNNRVASPTNMVTKVGIFFRRTSNGFSGSLCQGNQVADSRVDTSGVGTEGHGIKMDRCFGMRVIGNQVDNCDTSGIHLGAGAYGGKVQGNTITRCSIRNGAGIYSELNVPSRIIFGTGISTTTTAAVTLPATLGQTFVVAVTSATGILAPSTLLLNNATIAVVQSVSGTNVTCIATDNLGGTIPLGATVTQGSPEACEISHNEVSWCRNYGISLSYAPGTNVSHNMVHDNGAEGIISDSARVTISHNKVWNNWNRKSSSPNPGTAPNVKAQIRQTAAPGTATRGKVMNNDVWDSMPTAPNSDYGIAVADASCVVTGNDCTGHATGPIFEVGNGTTNVTTGNTGYTNSTQNGTATLVAGTVTVSTAAVAAGSRIFLSKNSGTSTGALRVSARTAGTSFVITSSDAADTSTVAWKIEN